MRIVTLFFLFIGLSAHAFTLNNNFGGAFKKKKVSVYVDQNTICFTSQMTADELADMIKPAINDFWNAVPTSSLRLKAGGFVASGANDINNDRLCAPTDLPCINGATEPLIPPVTDIIIACNDNPANFGTGNTNNVLAVTVPNHFASKKIVGAVILINDSSVFGTLSHSDKISVLAHEIGHAIGLGHAENKNKESLMYYKTVDLRRSLAQDDIDGVSYLYPVKTDGCGLFTGTISTNGPGPSMWQMGGTLGLLILIFELLKFIKRPKACATT